MKIDTKKICLNIRFDIDLCGHVAGSVDTVSDHARQNNIPRTNTQTCKYRKVSDKQQVRARERLQKFKSNPTTIKHTQSETNNSDTPFIPENKKRKHDDRTPEMPRINFNDCSHLIETPEAVVSDDHFILGEEPVLSASTPEDPDSQPVRQKILIANLSHPLKHHLTRDLLLNHLCLKHPSLLKLHALSTPKLPK